MATRKKTTAPVKKTAAAKKPASARKVRGAKLPENKGQTVDEFMRELDHPFKDEVQAIREIIKGAHQGITEEVKWRAPSFSYKGYFATFNLWERERVHLVLHDGAILDPKLGILEGEYPDRRMVYFADLADVKAKKPALVKAVKQWVRLMDEGTGKAKRA